MGLLLSLEGVCVGYGRSPREIRVLNDVSLELYEGEIRGIWGTRRSGKTTLANVVAGLSKPDRGRVLFDGYELAPPKRLRRSRLHQDIALVRFGAPQGPPDRRTVIEHVSRRLQERQGLYLHARQRRRWARGNASEMLARLALTDYKDERWGDLAHRERVLVAVAAALISMPRLLILDDFGLGLDLRQRDRLQVILRDAVATNYLGVLLTSDSIGDLISGGLLATLADGELKLPQREGAHVIDFPARKRSA